MAYRTMLHPERFQGAGKTPPYFEGWYFKQISSEGIPLVIIPGASLSSGDSHAFIQIIAGEHATAHYFRFPLGDFNADPDAFSFRIGDSRFSDAGIHLDLSSPSFAVQCNLTFGPFTKLEGRLLNTTIMGPFAWIPFLQCRHGINSLTHAVDGEVTVNGRTYHFRDSLGYSEKDWGTSFPTSYVWLQCNHFPGRDTSLFFSLADIPFAGTAFTGFIAVFLHEGRQYRFATYNHSKAVCRYSPPGRLSIRLTKGRIRLDITVKFNGGHVLKSPKRGSMSGEITESLQGALHLKLYDGTRLLCSSDGRHAGVEVVNYPQIPH